MVKKEELEEGKLGTIREAVEYELAEVQRTINTRKRVDQTESQLGDVWIHKQALKHILEEIDCQIRGSN